jgi:hypothetical protein
VGVDFDFKSPNGENMIASESYKQKSISLERDRIDKKNVSVAEVDDQAAL